MDRIWLAAPSPAMRVWPEADRHGWRVNAAAADWAERAGVAPADWPVIAAELFARQHDARPASGRLAAPALRWVATPMQPGWLVWLNPADGGPWRSAEEKLALVQEFGAIGVFERNLRTMEARWDAQLFRLFGFDPKEGVPDFERTISRVHPDDRARFRAEHARFVREGGRHGMRYRVRRPDGQVIDLQSLVEVRRDAQGPLMMIGLIVDDTDAARERAQALSRRIEGVAEELALRANQAKSEFLARVSHELRTPLNAVLGFAQLIEHDGAGAVPAVQLERVGRIRLAGEYLLTLVDDVLDLAAIEAGTLPVVIEPVAIDAVLGDVAQWLASQAQRAQVALHLQHCGGLVRADARRLRQIVANLVGNAVKFNRAGGNVWLSARREAAEGGAADRWRLSVRDDGRGVEAAQHDKLFEPFDRLDAERDGVPGVGLGLTIVQRLAEFMGGRVEVASTPGQGSEFGVWLDAAEADSAAPPRAAVRPASATPLSVLYIEDNPVNVILVQELVAMRPGVQLHCVETGAAGVAAALLHRPELVLVDMQLPDFDGFEVLRRLRAEPSLGRPVLVALSANSLAEDIARARAAGFDDYWTKPIDLKQFLAAFDALVLRLRPEA
jgi:signal transduction histidine kinase/ActR/RegA family two-component response regulator